MISSPLSLEVSWLGSIDYLDAWDLQKRLAIERASGRIPDTLLLLEHPPVYTTGRRGAGQHLKLPAEALGAPLIESDRGGDITFHGPGQLVAYGIVDLRCAGLGISDYVCALEEALILTLRDYSIEAERIPRLTGVWVNGEKIAAIGVRVSRPGGASGAWVTTHGAALNVDVDLGWFERIVPCGIPDRGVTSMERLVGAAPVVREVGERFTAEFAVTLGRRTSLSAA